MASTVDALVIAGPGTNRDRDVAVALRLAGAEPEIRLVGELVRAPERIGRADLVVIAGGFSYGDSLGAGRMLALDLDRGHGGHLGEALRAIVERGRPVLGICNGFQVLTRCGLVPGTLGHNVSGRFACHWVELAADPASNSIWTDGVTTITCPIAHGEGRYVHDDPDGLAAAGQVALRYADINPNGSVSDIAGVSDASGVVLGLMPHPENHLTARQHPDHRHDATAAAGDHLGLHLIAAGVRHAAGL